jgi:hypothetical protein
MKMSVFWDVAPCSLVDVYRRFRGAYSLHHQVEISLPLLCSRMLSKHWNSFGQTGSEHCMRTGIKDSNPWSQCLKRLRPHSHRCRFRQVAYRTSLTKQSPSWETDSHSDSKEISFKCSLACSQKPTTGPYLEAVESSQYPSS